MDKIKKDYSNTDITVTWQPHLCIHSTVCFARLPKVFRPNKRPWIVLDHAETDAIIETVDLCPTDALTWRWNDALKNKQQNQNDMDNKKETTSVTAKVFSNGPLLLPKEVILTDAQGKELKAGQDKYICRCGKSQGKPFCDGSHMATGFEG